MYIHIGEDLDIRGKDIIAILDRETVTSSPLMKDFLEQNRGRIIDLSKKSVKSIVITKDKVYLSPLASGTLKKRSTTVNLQEF